MSTPDLTTAPWRKSSHSSNNGTCLEVAPLPDGRIAVRNSNHPDAGTLLLGRDEMRAWLDGIKAGEFDTFA